MTNRIKNLSCAALFFCVQTLGLSYSSPAIGQNESRRQEAGLPFLQNFKPKDYDGMPQNWAIVQDRRGVMYFGNTDCVLEYDGSTWRKISLPGSLTAHSLVLDEQGQIIVGGINELGYLVPDGRGQMRYISLLAHVPETERNFGRVRKIVSTPDAIFFETENNLYRLQRIVTDGAGSSSWKCRVWNSGDLSYRLHAVHDQILAALPQKLFVLRGDSLHLLINHAGVTNATINLILPYPQEAGASAQEQPRLLLGTRSEGLFLYEGASLLRFECEANAYLQKNNIYHGALLPDGRYAFATLWGGAVLMDQQGRLLQIINKAAGLHNENILYVFPDREGGLWLGTDGGIARVETASPISFYQEGLGINGIVLRMIRHRNRLYVGASSGLVYLADPPGPGFAPVFKFVPGMQAQTRVLLSDGTSLLVGGSEGLFRLDENGRHTLIDEDRPDCFLRSKKDPTRTYVGLVNGLAVLQSIAGKPQGLVRIPGISGDVYIMVEDSAGVLWVAERQHRLSRLELPREAWGELTPVTAAKIKIERFGPQNGLPEGWVGPEELHTRILISTAKGLRRFDPATRTFPPDSSLGAFFADTSRIFYALTEDAQKQIWMVHSHQGREEIGVAVPGEDGSYTWRNTPFSRMSEFGYMNHIYADPDRPGVMWLACEETLVRYDATIPRAAAVDFSALVRRVTMKNDSVVYGGAALQSKAEIAYANNALRFEYGAPTFDNVAATRYQYFLEGFDEHWSDWTAETKKEYTNLSEGEYRFRVRARNVYERLSNEGVFAFTILPPWYRAWWAYGIYLLFAGASVLGLVRWRVHALQQKARQLEATIAERTAQVVEQKNRLEEQAHQLQEMDRVKSRFFANISHEFRTPLTLILGPLERVLQGAEKYTTLDDTRMMHRNASNLLRLVNQLLELVKLEAGKLRLQASAGDMVECLKSCIASFDSLARARKIALRFDTAAATLPAWFNRMQLEEVFYNVVSNAFKFTPEGGEVSVRLVVSEERRAEDAEQGAKLLSAPSAMRYAVVSVKDTGIGIPADKLPYVFERFYQAGAATGAAQTQPGTGIGLALVKELVELHYGNVEIKSAEGKGTEVTVCLPLGREHLKEEEIVAGSQLSVDSGIEAMIERRESSIEDQATSIQDPASSLEQDETLILVVEDNADMRAYIRHELEGRYKVLEAQNGKEGLEKATEIIPDLVISDVMMPEMDGFVLCDRLKSDERTSHIPIILLTAKAAREDKLAGLQTGADDYLTKPFDAVELQARVKNLIAVRRKLQEKFRGKIALRPSEISVESADEAFLKKVVIAAEAHLEDEMFSPEDLAREVGMSRAQFYRKLRALTGQPAGLFIRSLRLERAADLLKQGAGNITEIAYKVGFSSHPYFSKCFHEHFGMSPKDFVAKWVVG